MGNGFRWLLVATEVIFIWQFLSAVAERGWPTGGVVLWFTIIIEMALGYLAYRLFLTQLRNYADHGKLRTRRGFTAQSLLALIIMLVGIGGPIAIYYSGVEMLKPASTSFYFLLTANTLYLLAALRKVPGMVPSEASAAHTANAGTAEVYAPNLFSIMSRGDEVKAERFAVFATRIWHCLELTSIVAAMMILVTLVPRNGIASPWLNDATSVIMVFMFYSMAGLWVLLSRWKRGYRFFMMPLSYALYSYSAPYLKASFSHLWRICWLEAVAATGFLMGFIGGLWYAVPLFILSGALLVRSYPTDAKWQKMVSDAKTEVSVESSGVPIESSDGLLRQLQSEIADLDVDFRRGNVSKESYERQKAQKSTQLDELLQGGEEKGTGE